MVDFMKVSEKWVRTQLKLLKPFVTGSSLEAARISQNAIGEIMSVAFRKNIKYVKAPDFHGNGGWMIPNDERRSGVILYVHGGGYTCGGIEYAKGFESMLADQCGMKVFCVAYRLAPENPFPAALEDVLDAYDYLNYRGYSDNHIVLCGESAGGGLIYSLCFKLRELGRNMPAGIIAISPWTDLTASGKSYNENKDLDPSMTIERLSFFADCYTNDRKNPYVSPLLGDLSDIPPSLIFVGGYEIMKDDAVQMHNSLIKAGRASELIITPRMWHGYVLYGLREYNKNDFQSINEFLNSTIMPQRKLRWLKLDNAAKIFPASRRKNWTNVFRLSVTLNDNIDPVVLQSALDVTVRRFPSVAGRLKTGMFWYYLEEINRAPEVVREKRYPLTRMPFDDIRRCAFRVLYYRNRIAVEFFHALTDGNGGLIFLKSLAAEYILQKKGKKSDYCEGVLNRVEEPSEGEFEDGFVKYAGDYSVSRSDSPAFRVMGKPEYDSFLHVTTGIVDVNVIKDRAASKNVSVTTYLAAIMTESIVELQNKRVSDKKKQKPVKVQIPVNMRRLFSTKSLRNFAFYINVGINPCTGEYSFDEIIRMIESQMKIELDKNTIRSRFTTNVKSEQVFLLKIMPLFVKNIAMRIIFDIIGERSASICMSNLGLTMVPQQLGDEINRFDFVLGVQSKAPYNCGMISFKDKLYINFIRNTIEPELERVFFTKLVKLGIPVFVESNQRTTNDK